MTTNYCVSCSLMVGKRARSLTDLIISRPSARKSTGHRTRRSASTPWLRWPPRSSSPTALITQTKTSPNFYGASPPSTPLFSAGPASRLSSSSACPPTCASRRSSSSSPSVPRATPTDSMFPLPLFPSPHADSPCQIHHQGHAHRPPHIRHFARPARGSRHPTARGALPTRRRDRHGSRADPMRRREPGDAGRSRCALEDLVGRAE